MCKGTSSKESWPGVNSDFSNSSSFIHWLFISGHVSLAFWPGLPICKTGDDCIIFKDCWVSESQVLFHDAISLWVISLPYSSHDCPGVRTRCFSFGFLFSCEACSLGPQRLFWQSWQGMLWGSWNLVLRKGLDNLDSTLVSSPQQGWLCGTQELTS